MNNMQHYSYPYRRPQLPGFTSYNQIELQKANIFLIYCVDHSHEEGLNKELRYIPSTDGDTEMMPNLWEGDDGTMEHIFNPFPMPAHVSSFQEQDDTEFYEATSSSWQPHGNVAQQPPQVVNFPEIPPTCEFTCTASSANLIAESTQYAEKEYIDEKINKKERNFWVRISKIHSSFFNLGMYLNRTESRLFSKDEKVLKQACQELANLHRTLKTVRGKLVQEEHEYETRGYREIFKLMPYNVRQEFRHRYGLKGNVPTKLKYVVAKCDRLKSQINTILRKQANIIEPFKAVLSEAIEDMLAEPPEVDEFVFSEESDVEYSDDCTEGQEEYSFKNVDRLGKFQGDSDEIVKDDDVGEFDVNNVDSKADAIKFTKEDLFWNKLTDLRRTISRITTKILKQTPENPKKGHQQFTKSNCLQLIKLHKRITYFSNKFNKLKAEMETKNYVERGPFGLDDLHIQEINHIKPVSSSLDVLDIMLNHLKCSFNRLRSEKNPALRKFHFVTGIKDLVFKVNEKDKKVIRFCAHSGSDVNVNTNCSLEESLTQLTASGECFNQTCYLDTDVSKPNEADGTEECQSECPTSQSTRTGTFFQTGTKSTSKVTADFLEKEKQHWDRVQALYKKIDRAIRQLESKSKDAWVKDQKLRIAMDAMHTKMNDYSRSLAAEKSESEEAGYCKEVSYRNLEFQQPDRTRLLVRSLAEVTRRLDDLFDNFFETVKKLGMSHLYDW